MRLRFVTPLKRVNARHQIILATFLATFTMYVERVGFSIAFTSMARDAGIDESVKGTVFSAFYWGYGLSQVSCQRLNNSHAFNWVSIMQIEIVHHCVLVLSLLVAGTYLCLHMICCTRDASALLSASLARRYRAAWRLKSTGAAFCWSFRLPCGPASQSSRRTTQGTRFQSSWPVL